MKTRILIAAGLALHARTITTTRHLIFRRACLWTGFLAFATIAFGPQPAQAAVTEAWVHRYSNVVSSADRAVKVVRDAAGDIIVTGSTAGGVPRADMLTIKYSGADGSVLWQQRYNGPANSDDRPSALAVDGSGNVVVTGFANVFPDQYAYTVKYAAADGVLLWEKRYHGDGIGNPPIALAVDGSGDVVLAGYYSDSHGTFYTAKYAAADGALLWEKRPHYSGRATALAVDGSGNVVVTGLDYYTAKYAAADGALLWEKRGSSDWPNAVALDASGNVVVTGYSYSSSTGLDYYTAKYAAADGALVWEQRYDGPANHSDRASALAVDASGNVVVTGYSSNGANSDYYTAKYAAADGALVWEQRYNGPTNAFDFANAVAVDDSGNVVVTGRTDGGVSLGGPTGGDYYTAKYAAADGVLLWEREWRYDSPWTGLDIANAVAVDASGNVVVTGLSWNGTNDYYHTAKYAAADGAPLWEKRYNGSAPSDASAQAVAVDGSGNVAVTGVAYNTDNEGGQSDGDYYTAKYAAADGALLWERRYNGPANYYDQASGLVVDGSGNVVVTGNSFNTIDNPDYYTAKYAAANGSLLWEKRGPRGGASAVAVDGSGNVVVTGSSYRSSEYSDLYTAKYAAADGALLWEKSYSASANSYDSAAALAIDASGNVVVTGWSLFWGVRYDYYTAKYAAADGALLWEKRDSPSQATAVAVDGSGNVVVTGTSYGTNSNADYYTAKYAAADGALLWEKRFTGPSSVGDSSHSLALGPDGMVAVTGSSSGGYATVVYREVLAAVSIDLIPTGVRLRFTGVPGRSYYFERAPALTGWSTINTQTAPASGLLEYLDTLPHPGSGFYRIVQP